MVLHRPPGVYVERGATRTQPLSLLPSGVPCFLGLAERGPTNEPVRIASFSEFHDIFGRLEVGSALASAVDGFFLNGGLSCYVMRIAHLFERGRKEIAARSSVRLRDEDKQNTLLVQAVSEGLWGNQVRVSVLRSPPPVQTLMTVDAHPGDTSAIVKSTYGFARGTLIRIFDDGKSAYRIVTHVESQRLHWTEPLTEPFLSSAPTQIEPSAFDLVAETHSQREVFRNLNLARQSTQFAERVVNGVSKLIEVTNLDAATPAPAHFPVEQSQLALEGGRDGLFTVAAEDFLGADLGPGQRYGLAGLGEFEDIDLIVMPDLAWCLHHSSGFKSVKDIEIIQQAAVAQCEAKKDRFAILDIPPDSTPKQAMQWRRLFDSSYAAFYYPYLVTATGGKAMPPSGHVAGIYARCDREQGVYRAPANEAMQGAVDLEWFLQQQDIAMLTAEGINCLHVFPQRGIRVWGARTAASDSILRFVNVRRTLAAVARALHIGLQWVVFEHNDAELWQTIGRDVTFFLESIWRQGYLQGATADEAFFVRCDEQLNTAEVRERGQVLIDIGLAPFRPAEFIGIRVVQETDVLARPEAE